MIANQPRFWSTSLRQGQTDSVGPWIGLVQIRHQAQEPKGGWQWISGESLAYANCAWCAPSARWPTSSNSIVSDSNDRDPEMSDWTARGHNAAASTDKAKPSWIPAFTSRP